MTSIRLHSNQNYDLNMWMIYSFDGYKDKPNLKKELKEDKNPPFFVVLLKN